MAGTKMTAAWKLTAQQHGVVSRRQLQGLGFGRHAIGHRLRTGRLFPLAAGVYAVGRPDVDREGELMAAVLAAGGRVVVSHATAAHLWGLDPREPGAAIHVTGPAERARGRAGIRLHRRRVIEPADRTTRNGIPVTSPARTIVDTAPELSAERLERRINLADSLDLIDPDALAAELHRMRGQRGVPRVRALIGRYTFRLTDSELEQRFLRIIRPAGLPIPQTRRQTNSFRTDFVWPELGLVVEADSLRYHRTVAQQQRDHLRDQTHLACGMVPLRFTHHQITYKAAYVRRTIVEVIDRQGLRSRFGRS